MRNFCFSPTCHAWSRKFPKHRQRVGQLVVSKVQCHRARTRPPALDGCTQHKCAHVQKCRLSSQKIWLQIESRYQCPGDYALSMQQLSAKRPVLGTVLNSDRVMCSFCALCWHPCLMGAAGGSLLPLVMFGPRHRLRIHVVAMPVPIYI